jgi:uncharacterized protein YlxP (DUF503 family)
MTVMVPGARSLKDKRAALRRIKDRTANQFHVAVAEVGAQDVWQRAVLGFAVVSGDRGFADSAVDKIARFIGSLGVAAVVDVDRDVLAFGGGIDDAGDAWMAKLGVGSDDGTDDEEEP